MARAPRGRAGLLLVALVAGCASPAVSTATGVSPRVPIPVHGSPSPSLSVDPSRPLEPQMIAAVRADDPAAVRAILDAGLDPDADLGVGIRALHYAAGRGEEDLVRLLVAAGATVNTRTNTGLTPLLLAAMSSSERMVTLLLGLGGDPAIVGYALPTQNVLHDAAAAGNVGAIAALLDFGVDIDIEDVNGTTPLLLTTWFSHAEAASYLLSRGADVTQRDASGRTPMDNAIARGDDEIVAALKSAGATE